MLTTFRCGILEWQDLEASLMPTAHGFSNFLANLHIFACQRWYMCSVHCPAHQPSAVNKIYSGLPNHTHTFHLPCFLFHLDNVCITALGLKTVRYLFLKAGEPCHHHDDELKVPPPLPCVSDGVSLRGSLSGRWRAEGGCPLYLFYD